MCGIFGFVSKNQSRKQNLNYTNAFQALRHRGPDHEAIWRNEDGSCVMGHTRLSIVDLSVRGNQPMFLLNRYTIVYNGEVYNYPELKKQLQDKGHVFQSESDTEVVLALYHYQKEHCLLSLEGMFAFSIWDEQEKTLFCARDRIGEKPFYFNYDGTTFSYASEIKGLWALGISREVNLFFVYNYLLHNQNINPYNLSETFYENIKSLKPGHYIKLNIETNALTEVRYWEINLENKIHNKSITQITEEYKELFICSIKKRLRADVPVGVCLSGGLDSSSIACVADKFFRKTTPLHTYSSRFKNYSYDEGHYIDSILREIQAIDHQNFIEVDDFVNNLDEVFHYHDGPFNGASYLAEYQLMKLVKKTGVKVVLDGQGADEILGGYPVYFETILNKALRKTPWKTPFLLNQYQEYNSLPIPLNLRALTIAYLPLGFKKAKEFVTHNRARKMFREDFIETAGKNYLKLNIFDDINEHLKFHTIGGDLLHMLQCSDKSSMASSVEVRMPFLDYNLIEFLFKLPSEYKLKNLQTKYIHRTAMKGILPENIRLRKDKNGYMAPHETYLKDPRIKALARESLKGLINSGILREDCSELLNIDYMTWRIIMMNKLVNYKPAYVYSKTA